MDVFFDNARKIFDIAEMGGCEDPSDFALLIRPDGALHLIMDSPVSLEGAAVHGGARVAYHISRSHGGVRVTGQMPGRSCMLEARTGARPAPSNFTGTSPDFQRGSKASVVRASSSNAGGRSTAAFQLLRDQPLYETLSGNGGGSSRANGSGNGGGNVSTLPMLTA